MNPEKAKEGNLTHVCVFRVAQRSEALHLSNSGVTTDPGSIPGCFPTGLDRESHRAAHNWAEVVRVRVGVGRGI